MFFKYPERVQIYKVKPWCIYFKYNGEYYMVHTSDDGYESFTTLYKRNLNDKGNYKLEELKSVRGGFYYKCYANKPYKFINKNRFVYDMTKRGLCYSRYSNCLNKRAERIGELIEQMNALQAKINRL